MTQPDRPRLRRATWEFPVHHMRGGTSTGLVIWERIAPREPALRDELLRRLMGVPLDGGEHPGNRQTTGLGRGLATSNKVFFADVEHGAEGTRVVSTLAQLAADHGRIDWSVNCGNMSAALQLWALDTGLLADTGAAEPAVEIFNTNTGVRTTSRMALAGAGFAEAEIPGVMGRHPAVDLFLHHPAGSRTGALLPTGRAIDRIAGIEVSCVDVAVPMVIARAADFGKTAHESVRELAADADFLARFKEVWVEAGLLMGLRHKDGRTMSREEIARSETVPKACIIGPALHGGDLAVRYLTPQTVHGSMAVTGGCCLAAATLVPGSTAHQLCPRQAPAGGGEVGVRIENPAGILGTTIVAHAGTDGLPAITSAAYQRSTQVLLAGHVPLTGASPALVQALVQAREASAQAA